MEGRVVIYQGPKDDPGADPRVFTYPVWSCDGFLELLTGTVEEIAATMRGYEQLGGQHIMFQCEPYGSEALKRLTEALQLYRG